MDSINSIALTGHVVSAPRWVIVDDVQLLRFVVHTDDAERPFEVPVLVDHKNAPEVRELTRRGTRVVVMGALQIARHLGVRHDPGVCLYARRILPYLPARRPDAADTRRLRG